MGATRRKKARAPSSTSGPTTRGPSDRRLAGGLAVLVLALGALVWWSLPGNHGSAPRAPDDHETPLTAEGEGAPRGTDGGVQSGVIERPPRASAELAVITERAADSVRSLATPGEIGKHLDVRHCGGACDAVRKFMADEGSFEIEILKTEDLLLPPRDTLDTVAPGLTPNERATVHGRPTAVVVRTQGPTTPEQLPARAAFAVAAALAERLDGFVYDEVSRRIETAAESVAFTIRAKLGEPVFTRRQIVIQVYRQEDGTARLLSLGMSRFGSPDITLREANMTTAPLLAEVINAVASQLAAGKDTAPLTVSLADVARVVGKPPRELNPNADTAKPVTLDVVTPERTEGDPDNEMIELVPPGGASRESWEAVAAALFGAAASVTTAVDDKELADVARRAQRDLPAAIKQFEGGAGELFVKGPFPIPLDARPDGGAASEMLWLLVASCDAERCTGVLSNEPSYATNMALGKTTSVKRSEAVDWMIQQRDGGVLGGDSIKVLRKRRAP